MGKRPRRENHARAVDVPVGTARQASRLPRSGDPRPSTDRRALPRARRRHDRRVGRALARQRRLSRELQCAVLGHVHEQRAAAFHPRHAVRVSRQPGARPADRRDGHRARDRDARARDRQPRTRIRHAGADALHERRPALQGRVDRRLVHVASARRKPALRRGAARSDREERLERRVSRERVAVAPLQRQRQPRGIDPRDQPRILPAGRPARGRAVEAGDFKTFCAMLPEYNTHCHGEGGMHDTAMLLGLLGWDRYDKPVEIVTDYFASSGTGQINAIFPLA